MPNRISGCDLLWWLSNDPLTTSPFLMLPLRTAASRAKGIEPADVLPYSAQSRHGMQ